MDFTKYFNAFRVDIINYLFTTDFTSTVSGNMKIPYLKKKSTENTTAHVINNMLTYNLSHRKNFEIYLRTNRTLQMVMIVNVPACTFNFVTSNEMNGFQELIQSNLDKYCICTNLKSNP